MTTATVLDRLPKPRPESLEAVARFLDTNADPDAVVRVGFEDMAEKLTVPVEDLMVDLRVIIDAGLIEKADITSLYAKIVYPPVWEWDGSKPLESAREWETSMLSCRHIGSAAKNLASLYRAVGHMTNGEGYLSIEFGMDVLDCNERNLKKRRGELRESGWLTDTGRDSGGRYQLPIYAFTVGHCGCTAPRLGS